MCEAARRILFFLQPGRTSRHAALDMIAGLQSAGHAVSVLELGPLWERLDGLGSLAAGERLAATTQVGAFIRHANIDLSISFWANALTTFTHGWGSSSPSAAPAATSCFDLWDSPHLMYWFDAPHWAQGGSVRDLIPSGLLRGPRLRSVVNNAGAAHEMTGPLGFGHAAALPYAIHERAFHPEAWLPAARREFDLAVATGPGDPPPTPLMLRELERDDPDTAAIRAECAARALPGLRVLAERTGPEHASPSAVTHLLERLLATQLANPHTPMLRRLDGLAAADPALGPARAALCSNPGLWIDASAHIRSVDSWRRPFITAFLCRRLRTVLFGEGPDALDPWGIARGAAATLGYVPHEEQRRAYGRARLALSAMRWQDDTGIHLKPLEAGASGTLPLCEWRSGLAELLEPGTQVAAARTPGELAALARTLLAQPERIDGMAQAALVRIRREHTWKVRSGQVLAALSTP